MWSYQSRLFLLVLLIVIASFQAAAHSIVFSVAETGETEAVVELTDSALIAVPPDVAEPEVIGGTATKAAGGFRIDTSDKATVSYTSSYHTRKEQGVWHFEADPGDADSVIVVLPQAVHVVQAVPQAVIVKEESWQLTWQNLSEPITVSYVRIAQAEASRNVIPLSRKDTGIWVVVLFVVLAAGAIWLQRFRTAKKPEVEAPEMTEGQLNVIRAANKNEATVLTILLKHNGHIKRNVLERESGLSKSSLASTLKNLEHKNLVTIDRTFFTHYLKITPWFAELS